MKEPSEYVFDTEEGKMLICRAGVITSDEMVELCKHLEVLVNEREG